MTEPYYVAGPERSARVRALFDRIAQRYDLINDIQSFGLHRLWKRKLTRMAGRFRSARVLDVCCGTGDLALGFGAGGATVIGCDFSRRMLEVAIQRKRKAGTPVQVEFLEGDALALPGNAGAFDIVTIGYGLRNLASFQRGISELLRVLKPGGLLLILDFGKPPNLIWRAIYFGYLRAVVPIFGLLFCRDAAAYSYILESLLKYPAQEGVSQMLRSAGCEVEMENFLGGVMSIHRAIKPASLRESDDVPLVPGDLVRQ